MLFDTGSVEREAGIGKDALRVWERRYGFPVRDEHDERLYPQDQVDRLRLIKRLLVNGMRPSKVVGLKLAELDALLVPAPKSASQHSGAVLNLFNLIKAHHAPALHLVLNRALLQQELNDFLSTTIAPLNDPVGEA